MLAESGFPWGEDDIPAIEREARAAALAAVREAVLALPALTRVSSVPPVHHLVQKSQVTAILVDLSGDRT